MSAPERSPQTWHYCETCDVRFKSRSVESLKHGGKCVIVAEPNG